MSKRLSYRLGERVNVRHDQGAETGRVVGVLADFRFHVQFDADETISTWPATSLSPITSADHHAECARSARSVAEQARRIAATTNPRAAGTASFMDRVAAAHDRFAR